MVLEGLHGKKSNILNIVMPHACSLNPEAESSRFTGPSTVGGCDAGLIVHIGGQSSQ